MERPKLIFWRNFIGVTLVFTFLLIGGMLISLFALEDSLNLLLPLMHLPEIILGAVCILFLFSLLFLLCPMLALQFLIKRKLHS